MASWDAAVRRARRREAVKAR
jgi:hypothetical protein